MKVSHGSMMRSGLATRYVAVLLAALAAITLPDCAYINSLSDAPALFCQSDADCPSGVMCIEGACACKGAKPVICASVCADLNSDNANCGACGVQCGPDTSCVEGACRCPSSGQVNCDGKCVASDDTNCGTCGNVCVAPTACHSGSCGCPVETPDACPTACVDLRVDPNNCGSCGQVCPSPTTLCQAGQCVCPSGRSFCNGQCVDLSLSSGNCGACGNVCSAQTTCQNGQCLCPGGASLCGSTCVDLASDLNNCGQCGKSCSAGDVCANSACVPDYEWARWPIPNDVPPPSSYVTTTDTVTDSITGLVWQRIVPTSTFNWTDAQAYCANLSLAGDLDWRLPTLIELESIADFGTHDPAINTTIFPNTPASFFWTSTVYAYNGGNAWIVGFSVPTTGSNSESTPHYVRCVR